MIQQFSKPGLFHQYQNQDNQDAVCVMEDQRFHVIALSDGVTSCPKANVGAQIVSVESCRLMFRYPTFFLHSEDAVIKKLLAENCLYYLNKKAREEGSLLLDYSSTVSCVLWDEAEKTLLAFQIGDGLITSFRKDKYQVLIQPDSSSQGVCALTTSDAYMRGKVARISQTDIDSVALFSDGAWKHMLRNGRLNNDSVSAFQKNDLYAIEQTLDELKIDDDYSIALLSLGKNIKKRSITNGTTAA